MSTFNWPRELTLKLINLYREQPILYNPNHPEYKNLAKRLVAIVEIHQVLKSTFPEYKTDVIEIRKKIHGIRTQYSKEKKMRKQSKQYRRTLWCYDKLRFLDDADKETQNNADSSNKNESYEFNFSENTESNEDKNETDIQFEEMPSQISAIKNETTEWNFNFSENTESNENEFDNTELQSSANINESTEGNCTNSVNDIAQVAIIDKSEHSFNFDKYNHDKRISQKEDNTNVNINKDKNDISTKFSYIRCVKQNDTATSTAHCETSDDDDDNCFIRLMANEFKKIHCKRRRRSIKKKIFNLILDAQEEEENS